MPFLDRVNKAQAQRATAGFHCHQLQFLFARCDSQSKKLSAFLNGR
jgi:hypothetical protein